MTLWTAKPVQSVKGSAPLPARGLLALVAVVIEVEQIEQVAQRRAIHRHIRIVAPRMRVREIVPAPFGQRLQVPVALDEFRDRDVVRVAVVDMSALRELGDHDERDAWAVAEEVERLDLA